MKYNKELLDTHIEQIALMGIANNVVTLYQSLINYKQWFQ